MADCRSCRWHGLGGGGNFGVPSVVCGNPSETDPEGDCLEYEDYEDDDQDEAEFADDGQEMEN